MLSSKPLEDIAEFSFRLLDFPCMSSQIHGVHNTNTLFMLPFLPNAQKSLLVLTNLLMPRGILILLASWLCLVVFHYSTYWINFHLLLVGTYFNNHFKSHTNAFISLVFFPLLPSLSWLKAHSSGSCMIYIIMKQKHWTAFILFQLAWILVYMSSRNSMPCTVMH